MVGAAHCFSSKLTFSIENESIVFNFPNKDISVEYFVYAGAYNVSLIKSNQVAKFPSVKIAVRKFIKAS